MFHYYAKTLLPYNLSHTFWNFYLSEVLIIFLMGIDMASMLTLFILIKVKLNILDIFSRVYV